ncbi:procathepsin L-like [Homalodisca vitripennis]|uniref:procathepsin L-like n=1 Tax=Homalodisca vitripennis TaxID=197043 RepID=UPI001EE9FF5E|nr:procathepsin L-like [Homalodisca vitripennis]
MFFRHPAQDNYVQILKRKRKPRAAPYSHVNMKLLLLSALVVVALSHPLEVSEEDHAQWELFKVAHEREYDTPEEELKRKNIFLENLQFVREHNEKFENGEVTFDVEINKFSDLTTEEFVTMMNGYKRPVVHERTGDAFDDSENVKLPKHVDWRKKGAVTGVKDQGSCGATWAFSATGSLEGQHYLKTKKLVSLSEQNLIDCSTADGNSGCRGGLADTAYIYIQTNNGIDTEASYPYEAKQKTCRYNPKNKGATDNGFVAIQSFSEPDLQKAVATVGPISVAIDGSHTSFKHYKSGVYKQAGCSTMVVGQAVLAVGYGSVKKGGDYWLVKNSWGTGWGMNGYVMMARNDNNMCGIASMAGLSQS